MGIGKRNQKNDLGQISVVFHHVYHRRFVRFSILPLSTVVVPEGIKANGIETHEVSRFTALTTAAVLFPTPPSHSDGVWQIIQVSEFGQYFSVLSYATVSLFLLHLPILIVVLAESAETNGVEIRVSLALFIHQRGYFPCLDISLSPRSDGAWQKKFFDIREF